MLYIMPKDYKPHIKLTLDWTDRTGKEVPYRHKKTFGKTCNEY